MGADDLIANGKQVAVIEYHTGDAYANTYSNARLSYYGLQGTPTAWFDGGNMVVGGSHTNSMYNSYLPKYNLRIAIPSSFTIDVTGTNSGLAEYLLDITVEKVASASTSAKVLHVVLTESDIPQNWQGMTHLNHVERLMAPHQNGTVLDFSSGDIVDLTIPFTRQSSWVAENCEVVIFVQDTQTKEILQGIKRPLSDFITTNTTDLAILDLMVPNVVCNNSFIPGLVIANYGLNTLTSAEFSVFINGDEILIFPWTGTLEFMETAVVMLPQVSFSLQSSNTVTVEANNPNGQPDQYPANNAYSLTMGSAPSVTSPVSLALMLDQNPQETTWKVMNSTGEVLYSGGPYTLPNQFIVQQFSLPEPDCYSFIIYDDGGDGLSGNGLYKLAYSGTIIFAEGKFFGYEDHTQFNIGLTDIAGNRSMGGFDVYPNPANQQAHVAFSLYEPSEVHLAIYDGQGRTVHQSVKSYFAAGHHHYFVDCNEFESGVYFVRLITGETSRLKKLIIQ
jgi:hypothetical protein